MYALTDKQKIVPDDVRLIQKFKQSRTVSGTVSERRVNDGHSDP